MKRLELALTFLQVPLDYCLLILAGLTAYSLRYTEFITAIRPILFDLPFKSFFPTLLLVAAGWLIIFAFSGLYRINPNRKLAVDATTIIMSCSTGFAAIAVYLFFTLQKFDSRFLVLIGWLLAMGYLIISRFIIRLIRMFFYRRGFGLRRIAIIGEKNVAETIKTAISRESQLGFTVVSTAAAFEPKIQAELIKVKPDEILFTNPKTNEDETLLAIDFCNEHQIVFKYSADLFATISTNMAVSTIAGIPIIELRRTKLSGWGRIFKRLMDIIIGTLLLLVFSPLYLLAAIITLFETGRPIIYKNERVGQAGEKFLTLKFRSMYQNQSTGEQFGPAGKSALTREAELIKTNSVKNGPLYKIKDDPRVTPFGRFIRRWSIDELPQFINVLKGEMSLVGPRPHQPREVEQYKRHHRAVLAIKPGITGIAQISGRSNLNFEEEVRLDTFYLEHWNLLLDIIILIKTPFAVIKSKGAW